VALVHRVGWDPHFVRRSPWLWPISRAAELLTGCSEWPSLEELDRVHAALAPGRHGAPLRFVIDERVRRRAPPAELAERYDGQIALRGEVPTRPRNWHDVLNALSFATWPASKLMLHTRQCRAFEARPKDLPASVRTKEQDALTLFDEGGAIVAAETGAEAAVRRALEQGDRHGLGELERAGNARITPFGHALFEHMVEGVPCPGASARVIALAALPDDREALLDALDAALARVLAAEDRFLVPGECSHLQLEVAEPGLKPAGA
jgi:hypothetical protein